MDPASQEYEHSFLDLSDISEKDRSYLQEILFTPGRSVGSPELPWDVQTPVTTTQSEYRSWADDYDEDENPSPPAEPLQEETTVKGLSSEPVTEIVNVPVVSHYPPVSQPQLPPQQPAPGIPVIPPHNRVPPFLSQPPPSVTYAPPMYQASQVLPSNVTNMYVSTLNPGLVGYPTVSYAPQVTEMSIVSPVYVEAGGFKTEKTGGATTPSRRGRPGKPGGNRRDGQSFYAKVPAEGPVGNADNGPTMTRGFQPPHAYMTYPYVPQQYYTPPHHTTHHPHQGYPSAQHAAGTPIYLPSPSAMYHNAQMFGAYSQQHSANMYQPAAQNSSQPLNLHTPPLAEPVEVAAPVNYAQVHPGESSQTPEMHSAPAPAAPICVNEPLRQAVIVPQMQDLPQKEMVNGPSTPISLVSNKSDSVVNTNCVKIPSPQSSASGGGICDTDATAVSVDERQSVEKQHPVPPLHAGNVIGRAEPNKSMPTDNSVSKKTTDNNLCTKVEEIVTDKTASVEVVSPVCNAAANIGKKDKPVGQCSNNQPQAQNLSEPHRENKVGSSIKVAVVDRPAGKSKTWASLFQSETSSGSPTTSAVPLFSESVELKNDAQTPKKEELPISNHSSNAIIDPVVYRLGEFLRDYSLQHRSTQLQPRGLTNRANWCYINATLQALLACPPFYNLLKGLAAQVGTGNRLTGQPPTPILDSMLEFVKEFTPMTAVPRPPRKDKNARKDDYPEIHCGPSFEPSCVYRMLSSIQSATFKVEGRQEDAEEFLSCLLNGLNDELHEVMKLVGCHNGPEKLTNGDVSSTESMVSQIPEDEESEWQQFSPKNRAFVTRCAEFKRTPISDLFMGQLRTMLNRANKQLPTHTLQPFFTLPLDIESTRSVDEALEKLVNKDMIEGVTCARTNQQVEAWSQVVLEELPPVLVLHLKWFVFKSTCSKLSHNVEFPVDLKINKKLMSPGKHYSPKHTQYKLFGVVYHDGSEASKGHYITDVYHPGYSGWVRYDDQTVRWVNEAQVLRPESPRVPYLLYYRRGDTLVGSSNQMPSDYRQR